MCDKRKEFQLLITEEQSSQSSLSKSATKNRNKRGLKKSKSIISDFISWLHWVEPSSLTKLDSRWTDNISRKHLTAVWRPQPSLRFLFFILLYYIFLFCDKIRIDIMDKQTTKCHVVVSHVCAFAINQAALHICRREFVWECEVFSGRATWLADKKCCETFLRPERKKSVKNCPTRR